MKKKEVKHGGGSHDQSSHGNWASGGGSAKPKETASQRLMRQRKEKSSAALKPTGNWLPSSKNWGAQVADKKAGIYRVHDREVHSDTSVALHKALRNKGWKKAGISGRKIFYERVVNGVRQKATVSPAPQGRTKAVFQNYFDDPVVKGEYTLMTEFNFRDLQDFWDSGPPEEETKKKKKWSYVPSGRGNIEAFAGYIGRRVGGDPGVFTRCMQHPATEGSSPTNKYTKEQRAALCARIHKEWTGIWPGEHRGKRGKKEGSYPGGWSLGRKKESKAYDKLEYGEADGHVFPMIEDWDDLSAWLVWNESQEATTMKSRIQLLENELYHAQRFGHDLSSQYYFAIQGELVVLTNEYVKSGTQAIFEARTQEPVKVGTTNDRSDRVLKAALEALKHGQGSSQGEHDEKSHGNWARGMSTADDKSSKKPKAKPKPKPKAEPEQKKPQMGGIPSTGSRNRNNGRLEKSLSKTIRARWDADQENKEVVARDIKKRMKALGIEASESEIAGAIKLWAATSNKGAGAASLQEAASEELGVPLSDWQKGHDWRAWRKREKKGAFGSSPFGYDRKKERAFVRAMYENTQQHFADVGFKPTDTVQIFRGVGSNAFRSATGKTSDEVPVGSVAAYRGNAMESWSINIAHTEDFSRKSRGAIIAMKVPVANFVSTYATGLGTHGESEVLIMGTVPKQRARVVSNFPGGGEDRQWWDKTWRQQ